MNKDSKLIRIQHWLHPITIGKDGDTWFVLVGENIQDGEFYASEDKSLFGAVQKFLYEETNCWEGSQVEDLIPTLVAELASQLLNKLNDQQ